MRWSKNVAQLIVRKAVVYIVAMSILLGDFGFGLIISNTSSVATAAEVTIDTSAQTSGSSHIQSGSQTVFASDQIGYKFYRDSNGSCVYSKTTDGGSSWGSTITTDAQTDCIGVTVWYDQWTPFDSGIYIHILTYDTSADDLYYNRLDTSNDTLLKGTSPVDAVTNSGNSVATFVNGSNYASITKGTDGTVYMGVSDSSDSYIVECTTNCDLATSWIETGINPLDLANDYNILVPLESGNIMLINRDISLEDIRYKIWNNSSWSASWSFIDTNATDNTTYDVGMAAAVSSTTPTEIYLAYTGDNAGLGTDDDVRTAFYNGSTWTNTTDVVSNLTNRAITGVAIGRDSANGDVYVGYSARTTAGTSGTGNVYWKKSTDSMATWSSENGPVNGSSNDIYGVDINVLNNERLYESWFGVTGATIYGDTIADVFPGIHASTTGSQVTSLYASSTDNYVGGKFLIYENYRTEDVTGITITENGSVDGATNIANVKLMYDIDATTPYNCASVAYDGDENQFGSTDTNGFSGADGISSFSGTTVSVSTTTALCVYVVLDVLDTTVNGTTINVTIANPQSDITVSGGVAGPSIAQDITASTTVLNDQATMSHYHWRNDNGSEITATSKTGGVEDTPYPAFQQQSVARLRVEVSNEGGSSTPAMQYRLEYAETSDICDTATGWTDVGASGGAFDMFNSTNLTDGANTTNIANASGGVTDENTTFISSNAGVKDTSSQTASLTISQTEFVELEYAITASTSATEGNTYCFRVTNQGEPLFGYTNIARASIAADVAVTVATSSQTATVPIPTPNFYVGSPFVITENSSSRDVTEITITENGTIDAFQNLKNIKLLYDSDITAPYNCAGESYSGTELQFGLTDTDGFSAADGTATFTDVVSISTTSTLCIYPVVNVEDTAQDGQTINITIDSPATTVLVTGGGSVSPTVTRDLNGVTTLVGPLLTQTHYHWRNDNGDETTATSLSGGTEDTPVTYVAQTTPVRLRLQVSNEGSVTSPSLPFTLEYGAKITTCDAVSSWTDVGASGGAFDMFNSTNLTDGANTTNIANASGGVTDENTTFISSNAGVKDVDSIVASTTISSSEFIESEYSFKQTINAGYDITYCFRLTQNGKTLNVYNTYPELTTSPRRDFEIQRGTVLISGTSQTLTAGVDYVAPSSASSAFVRITNSHKMGAGRDALGGNQNANDVGAYILDPANIMTSFTIQRDSGAANNNYVNWEIIEYIGAVGGDNEMIVWSQSNVSYGTASVNATGTTVSGVSDDADIVVFITGQLDPDTARANYNSGQSTSEWNVGGQVPVFTRGDSGGDATVVSYAVVEFTGINWVIQRSEHTYFLAGTTETEPITALNSLSHAFIHSQTRVPTGDTGIDEFGHEVWLSSIGYVSYFIESTVTNPTGHTSVAWIIENTQSTSGEMDVTRSNGSTLNGVEPLTLSVSIGKTLVDLTNASIFINSRSNGTGTNFPRPIVGATIASSTDYILWRSDANSTLSYRTEIVEWPTAGMVLTQNYYRFYVENNALLPTDPWPLGLTDLGENMVLTQYDEPLGDGEKIRIRMSVKVSNATLPAETRSFKLQYAPLTTTCSAISDGSWTTVGNSASSTAWRGYSATGTVDGTVLSTDPASGGDLVLSVSDVAGTYEQANPTDINPYAVPGGSDLEYDWLIQQNGAITETYYCFRMVDADGTKLDIYSQYPQIRTASFTPRTQNWRFYDDVINETPISPLANENITPINIANEQAVKLRITVDEIKNISRDDVRFKLQYSQYANFSLVHDVVSQSLCTATSTWCYVDGGGSDNAKITSGLLSDSLSCSGGIGAGCGTHNESPDSLTGFRHQGNDAIEYEFTLKSAGPRVSRVYYFRLYDVVQDVPVSLGSGATYPSLTTEGGSLSFGMSGVASSTSVAGIVTDIDTTSTSLTFGSLPKSTSLEAVHRLSVDTNGTQGYKVYMMMDGPLVSASGVKINQITGTNASPVSWNIGCNASSTSCLGYHTTDATLDGGSARFAAIDTYSRINTTTPKEVAYSSQPTVSENTDIVFRILARDLQAAGIYESKIVYISVPLF